MPNCKALTGSAMKGLMPHKTAVNCNSGVTAIDRIEYLLILDATALWCIIEFEHY